MKDKSYVFVCPEIRAALIERFPATAPGTARILALGQKPDFESETLGPDRPTIQHTTFGSAVGSLWRDPPAVLEISEPLWVKHWPKAFIVAVVVKVRARLSGRRARVVCYAIENLDPRQLLTAARLPVPPVSVPLFNRLLLLFWRSSSRVVDRVVFGTPAARDNYVRSGLLARAAPGAVVELDLNPACSLCSPSQLATKTPSSAVFLGELSVRKGIPLLLEAWPLVVEQNPRATLTIAGDGDLRADVEAAARSHPSITYLGPISRAAVHDVLARTSVVVLPSQRIPTWREQVGLPIVEGLSHGATIVTTTETGLSNHLLQHGHHVIQSVADSLALDTALSVALLNPRPPSGVLDDLPAEAGRTRTFSLLAE